MVVMGHEPRPNIPWITVLSAVARYGSVFIVYVSYFDQPQLPWAKLTSALLLLWAVLAAVQDRIAHTSSDGLWVLLEAVQGVVVFLIGLFVDDSGWYWILYLVLAIQVSLTVPLRRGVWLLAGLFILRVANLSVSGGLGTPVYVESLVTTVWMFTVLSGAGYVLAQQLEEKSRLEELARQLDQSHRQLRDAYQQLREYATRIEEATVLKERARMAREIHDSLGHTMIGMVVQLEAASRSLDRNAVRAKEHLTQALQLANTATIEVRHAIKALRPPLLIRGQLILALGRLVEDFSTFTATDVKLLVDDGQFTLPEPAEVAIYRGVQESLTNAYNHGRASRIVVHLKEGRQGVFVRVRDNGRGTEHLQEGFGLEAIRSRVTDSGGTVRFRYRPARGFSVIMALPVEPEGEAPRGSYEGTGRHG